MDRFALVTNCFKSFTYVKIKKEVADHASMRIVTKLTVIEDRVHQKADHAPSKSETQRNMLVEVR